MRSFSVNFLDRNRKGRLSVEGKKAKVKTHWFARDWRLYVMLVLPVAFYLIFCYKPMIGIIVAFEKYNLFKGMWGSPWVGLDNFRFVMKMSDFSAP